MLLAIVHIRIPTLRRFRDIIIHLFSETEKPFRWVMTVKILGRQTFFKHKALEPNKTLRIPLTTR